MAMDAAIRRELSPGSFEEAAAALAEASSAGKTVRLCGGGTKLAWGGSEVDPDVIIRTRRLDATLEHNPGDLTAIFQAGVPLARAQAELGAHGQMLAVDPPLGPPGKRGATLGGVFATGDAGPLRHRYGQPRDLILGITVALSDGTIARAGGKVIKNVAGYDLAKLFTGSFGTLGLILSINVRLHPVPQNPTTALASASSPATLRDAALALAGSPLELEALDVAWRQGRGGLLAQVAGTEAPRRAARAARLMAEAGLQDVSTTADDANLWARQRAGQRSGRRAILRVAARPSQLTEILQAADAVEATVVGRAGFGLSYLEVDPDRLDAARSALPAGTAVVVLDLPESHRTGLDPWGAQPEPALSLMRSVKRRFDPAGTCNPGVFVGGI
jgi:glycolate oxidase FAD binding subunit